MKAKSSSAKPARPAARRAPRSPRPKGRSLAEVVGAETYQTWVRMLAALVPGGRTHRLAPLVAAMLQYATEQAGSLEGDEGGLALSLLAAGEASDPSEIKDLIHDAVVRLFKDAGVDYERTGSRGQRYSIADDAYEEYLHWFNMPWE